MQKSGPKRSLLLNAAEPRGLAVRLIPLLTAHAPIPLFHGLCAVRLVLLRDEGLLVGRDLREVMTALLDHRSNADEAVADLVLTLRQRRGAFVAIRIEGVQTLTIGVSGRRGAVGGNEIVAVVVTILFFRSFQGSADGLNTRGAYFH